MRSEQVNSLASSPEKEVVKSQAETEEDFKNRKRKRGGSQGEGFPEEERKEISEGKKSELAKLVAQQYKMHPLK